MKGKINKQGHLAIKRAGKVKVQVCPYQQDDSICGDWCPLFAEPTISKWMGSPDPNAANRAKDPKHWDLKICQNTLFFDERVDERERI